MASPESSAVLVGILAAASVVGVLLGIFYPFLSRKSGTMDRLARLPPVGPSARSVGAPEEEGSRTKKSIEAALKELEDKQKARKGVKPTLPVLLRQAGLTRWTLTTYVFVSIGAGVVTALLSLAILGLPLLVTLGFGLAGGVFAPRAYVNFRRDRRMRKFADEFPNAVDVIVRGVKSGLPLVDCLRIISLEAQEPVRSEFRAIIEDQTLGVPIDQSVLRLWERVPLTETNFFAIVIALQSRTGGSLSEALGNLSKVLRERKKMKAKIRAVSAEAKASAGIIGALPVVVASLIGLTSPGYIALLFTTSTGHIVLGVCAFWMFIGVMIMRKMINFDF